MFGGNDKADENKWSEWIKEVDLNGDGEVFPFKTKIFRSTLKSLKKCY